jgi:hypothetical protein
LSFPAFFLSFRSAAEESAFVFAFAVAFLVVIPEEPALRACDFFVCHSERSEEPLYFACSADNLSEK